jgi:hypothetical protein
MSEALSEYRHHRTCAFCHTSDEERYLLKYSVRRYAHPKCFAERRGFEEMAELPSVELGKVPIRLIVHGQAINPYAMFINARAREEGKR